MKKSYVSFLGAVAALAVFASCGSTPKAPATEVEEPVEKEVKTPKKQNTYIVAKRKEDDKWEVKISGSDRAIKLFKTKAEAVAYVKDLSERTGRGIVAKASKGAKKGKFQSI